MRRQFEIARELVSQSAARRQASFVAIGISVGGGVGEGLRHLEEFGGFDEVVAGRSWYNLGALRFVHGDGNGHSGASVTPQVVVVERLAGESAIPSLVRERVVLSLAGQAAIQRWLDRGSPVPESHVGPLEAKK